MARAESCRSCGASALAPVLDLGPMPLSDGLVDAEDAGKPDPRYPLEVVFCPDCALVQILEEVPPELLFVENYAYFSSYSRDLLQHSRDHALRLRGERGLGPDSLVVEVASNDGYFLRHLSEQGVPVLGIDPAPAQAAAARAEGIETLEEFLTPELAERVRSERGPADVVVANNVMAHTPTLNEFVESLRILLADDGVATIENAYVRDLVEGGEFDTIYHEHFCYFSTTSVAALMERHGLRILRAERLPIHGGSVRWQVASRGEPDPGVAAMLAEERALGMTEAAFYGALAERAERVRTELVELLQRVKADGARLAGYGAAAKAAILLNACGIGTELLDFVADRNPHKQGRLMPGVQVPIVDPAEILEQMPDYLVVLAWNFADEIVAQEREYERRGGRFVIPIPVPSVRG